MLIQARSMFMTADSEAWTILPSGSMPKTMASRLSRRTLTFKSAASFAAIRPSSSGSGSQIAPASRLRASSATHSRSLSGSFKKATNPAWSWDSAPRRGSCPGLRRPLLNGTRASSYYRARYYDAATGRFFFEDPTGFDSDFNFYVYVHSVPTILTDPSGLNPNNWGPIVTWFHLFWPGPQNYIPSFQNLSCTRPSECNFQPDMQRALICFQI